METISGDLLDLAEKGRFDVIVHGCNCFHNMGGGIARVIAHRYPEALAADRATSKGDRAKLGTISTAEVVRESSEFTVVNAYTQYDFGAGKRHADYGAITRCFEAVARDFGSARIGYPMIGAGLAGGDWSAIAPRIDDALEGCDHALVVLSQ